MESEIGLNSENSDFSPAKFGSKILFISDRWQKIKKDRKCTGGQVILI